MESDPQPLVIAHYALWAGDWEHAKTVLQVFAARPDSGAPQIFQVTAEALLKHLEDLISRVRSEGNKGALPAPIIEQSARGRYRAAAWTESPRDFSLLCYPLHLDTISGFPERLEALALPEGWKLEENEKDGCAVWVHKTGTLFLRMISDGWGLVRVSALWTELEAPAEYTPIKDAFSGILSLLDSALPPSDEIQAVSKE